MPNRSNINDTVIDYKYCRGNWVNGARSQVLWENRDSQAQPEEATQKLESASAAATLAKTQAAPAEPAKTVNIQQEGQTEYTGADRVRFGSYPTSHHAKQYNITEEFTSNFPPYWRYQTTNQFNNPDPRETYQGQAYVSKRHFAAPKYGDTYTGVQQ